MDRQPGQRAAPRRRPARASATCSPAARRSTLDFLGGDALRGRPGGARRRPHRRSQARTTASSTSRCAPPAPSCATACTATPSRPTGTLWLQYWFFYFYNDYNLALGIGLHEGDWEMIQLRIHDGAPDLAVYAQHRQAEKRPWAQVTQGPRRPQPADGLRRPRLARLLLRARLPSDRGVVRPRRRQAQLAAHDAGDRHRRRAAVDRVARRVGRHARARRRHRPAQPARTVRPRRSGRTPTAPSPPPWEPQRKDAIAAPAVDHRARSRPHAHRLRLHRASTGPPAASLQVTVNSSDEAGVPPRTYTFQVAQTRRGTLATEVPLDPAKHYDVYASTTERRPADPVGVGRSPSSTRRARWRSCRSPSGSWAASAASWPGCAASSGAEHPLAPAAPRAQVRMHGLWALRGLGQPRQPRREARARR